MTHRLRPPLHRQVHICVIPPAARHDAKCEKTRLIATPPLLMNLRANLLIGGGICEAFSFLWEQSGRVNMTGFPENRILHDDFRRRRHLVKLMRVNRWWWSNLAKLSQQKLTPRGRKVVSYFVDCALPGQSDHQITKSSNSGGTKFVSWSTPCHFT